MSEFRGPVVLITIYFIYLSAIKCADKKSLFDELPLNGALSFGAAEGSESVAQSNSAVSSDFVKPKANKLNQEIKSGVIETSELQTEPSQSNSLFDALPNQGAFTEGLKSNSLTRTTRNPLFSFDLNSAFDYKIELLSSKPPSTYSNNNNNNLIIRRPSIPPKVSQPLHESRNNLVRSPFLSSSSIFQNILPTFPASASHYRIPLIPRPQKQLISQLPTTKIHKPIPKFKSGHVYDDKLNRSYSQISANAAGPTVIVYANHDGKSGQSHKAINGKDYLNSVDKAAGTNEIHYHYHFNDDEKNATLKKNSIKSNFDAKRSNDLSPTGNLFSISRLKEHQEVENPNNQPSEFQEFNISDEDSSSSSEEEEEEEEEDFSPRQLHSERKRLRNKSEIKKSFSTLNYEQPPSVNEPVPPPSYYNSPSSSDSYSLPDNSYSPPPKSNSYEHHPPPDKYGPPPPDKYGPPPSDKYGPPPSSSTAGPPAPPSNDQPFVSEDRYHTTISLQTLPITRQVTEFVQVPNIIHHITSSQQSSISNDPPFQDEPPPPSGYGPSNHSKGKQQQSNDVRQRSTTPPSLQSQSGFQAHLSKLFGTPGLSTGNSATSFLEQNNRNRESELLQLLSLSDPNYASQYAPLQPQSNLNSLFQGATFGDTRGRIRQNLPFPIITGSTSSSSGSSVESLKEIIREQRYQNILNDLRSRLREESKSADRARSDYKSLFSRGALLLSALSLIPRVVSPFAAATAAAGGASTLTNYMLPLIPATGRRKRSTQSDYAPQMKEFRQCVLNSTQSHNVTKKIENIGWISCAQKLEIDAIKTCENGTTAEFGSTILCSSQDLYLACKSLIKTLRKELAKLIDVDHLQKRLGNLQLESCKHLRTLMGRKTKWENNQSTLLLRVFLRAFKEEEANPWIFKILEAGRKNECNTFTNVY